VQVFEQACQTIAYAHSKGVVHRDLKPQNIMVGAFGLVQVMDWGLGKVITHTETSPVPQSADDRGARAVSAITDPRTGDPDSHTRAGTTLGTYAYMPPEQARGEGDRVDERADVFGLGAVLCEILTGCPPYDGPLTEVRFLALLGRHEARPGCSLCPRHSAPQ